MGCHILHEQGNTIQEPRCTALPELQLFMIRFVDDLLRLYDEGIIVKTPVYPEGNLMSTAQCRAYL